MRPPYRSACVAITLGLGLALGPDALGAQENSFSIGTLRTEAARAAVRLAVKYAKEYESIFAIQDTAGMRAGARTWFFDASPQVAMLTGDEDAFQGVVAKLTGNLVNARVIKLRDERTGTELPGYVIDRERGVIVVLPTSIGVESDGGFRTVNALGEVGFVPLFPRQYTRPNVQYRLGVFLQGGYKFRVDSISDTTATEGGGQDESEEEPESGLFRSRATAHLNLGVPFSPLQGNVRLLGEGSAWYDFLNTKVYYRLDATVRLPLDEDKHFDFTFERGSGAPNFNTGEQFSANLTIVF
jgi:hypothetical protein